MYLFTDRSMVAGRACAYLLSQQRYLGQLGVGVLRLIKMGGSRGSEFIRDTDSHSRVDIPGWSIKIVNLNNERMADTVASEPGRSNSDWSLELGAPVLPRTISSDLHNIAEKSDPLMRRAFTRFPTKLLNDGGVTESSI